MTIFHFSLEQLRSVIDLKPHEPLMIEILDKTKIQITRIPDNNDPFIKSLNNPIHLGRSISLDELERLKDENWSNNAIDD
jgi:hypothetical protein